MTDWPAVSRMLLEHTDGEHATAPNDACGACQVAAGTFDMSASPGLRDGETDE